MNPSPTLRLTIIILAVALLAAIVPALQLTYAAGPWYVAPGGNDSNICASAGAPCATINGAIGKASAGDTIYVATGVYTGTGTQVVLFNKSATLAGGWDVAFSTQDGISTVDGESARGGISLAASITATIERFVVQKANAGGIYNGGTLTLTKSRVVGNRTDGSGGGIHNVGEMTVLSSAITNNVDGIMGSGGGIYNYGTLSVLYSAITDNLSHNGGGGIYNYGSLTLVGSSVAGNTAGGYLPSAYGGGIDNTGTVTLHNSTVSGNTSYGSGGGVSNYGGTLNLINSTVSGNLTTNIPGGRGGGVYDYFGSLALHSSTVSSNTTDYGGGVFVEGAGSVELENSIIAGNSARSISPDCSGTFSSVSYSFIGDTFGCTIAVGTDNVLDGGARLLPLTGSPGYHPLLPDSPAIDAGDPAGCRDNNDNPLLFDQRGAPRVGRCDIGAFEFGSIPASLNRQIFLPLVTRNACTVGICGYVTENGAPAGRVLVELRFVSGPTESTRASVLTTSGGRYSFTNVPSLMPGQSYYVRYLNETVDSRLSLWETRSLQTYTTGDVVNMGSFDIANIDLTAPGPGATVALPQLFQWTPRYATPLDNYEFNLFDPVDGAPSFYTEPPLGYTGGYTLRSLPGGFSTGIPYGWCVGVYDLSGGYGESFYCHEVTFSSAGPSLHVESRSKPLGKVNLSGYSILNRGSVPDRLGKSPRNDAKAP